MSIPARPNREYDESLAERAEALEMMFRERLRAEGIKPSGDDRVSEDTAALLLGFARGTMRNKRYADGGPRAFVIGRSVSYRVGDLARWLAGQMREYWPGAA